LEGIHSQTTQAQSDASQLEKFKKIFEAIQTGRATPEQQAQWNALEHDMNTRDASGRRLASPSQQRLFWDVTDAERASADRAAQTGWSQTSVGNVPDVGAARGAVGEARAGVQARTATDSELTALLNEFMGLSRDQRGATAQLRQQYGELANEVRELRESERNNRTTQ
jgi:hypothetical protein